MAVSKETKKEIYAWLEESRGYQDYNGNVEDIAEVFGLTEDEAETYVFNWASGLYRFE